MIPIKSEQDIQKMREGGQILARVHEIVRNEIRVGVTAKYLDDLVRESIEKMGAKPSFLGYQGYQFSTCISKNEEVVHGIPYPDKILYPGDICSIDIGVFYKGFHVDAARTWPVEQVDARTQELITVTEQSFFEAIKHAKAGNKLGKVSNGLQQYAEQFGFAVVRDLYSHGVGKNLHEDPLIPNYGSASKGPILKEGMTLAIEPMINIGTHEVLTLDDKWTIISADHSWSAHYENTICVHDGDAEILTLLGE